MAKSKITAAQYDAAEAAYSSVVSGKLNRMGAKGASTRFLGKTHAGLRKRQSRKHFEKYVAAGGDPGDAASFIQYLIDHIDEIISMIQKIIALFTVVAVAVAFMALLFHPLIV